MNNAHAEDPEKNSSNTLDEVIVVSDQDDFDARRESSSTKLIYGREELDRMNELTVGDYLRRLPSVTFTGPPGSPKDVRVRGMDKGYTQILIDGESVAGGGKERQIQVDRLPMDLVERIEIIRAPTADMPNEGLAGTINIVLRQAPSHRVANFRVLTGRVFGEEHDKDTYNLSGQYGDSTGRVRWLMNASVGSRGEVKTKTKSEQGFNAAGVRNNWKDEFEDEQTRYETIDFSPRINISLTDKDEVILTPFFSRTKDEKVKLVDKFKYNTPLSGSNYIEDGTKSEDEEKVREIARLRGEWVHKLNGGGQLSFYSAA
ncbi:MAG: TonB-dependent receptor plug domain-containing protein, partial [Nitrosomonadales bacterium]|nr:TonB-dependent receptor plug domain-containing protein [Nitrosomonadales bacterium]